MTDERRLDRRTFVSGALALPAAALLASCGGDEDARPVADGSGGTTTARDPARPDRLAPTPTCDDGDEPTASQTEGPFFTPDSPRRRSLVEAGMAGTRLVLAGLVLTTDCRPVRGAVLDFWQADDAGEYDNSGYRLRGNQRTDGRGRYELTTIVPGDYPGRTKHIHVKAARAGRRRGPHHPAVLPGCAGQRRRFAVRPGAARPVDGSRPAAGRAVRLRADLGQMAGRSGPPLPSPAGPRAPLPFRACRPRPTGARSASASSSGASAISPACRGCSTRPSTSRASS